jgi:hypothetical protein
VGGSGGGRLAGKDLAQAVTAAVVGAVLAGGILLAVFLTSRGPAEADEISPAASAPAEPGSAAASSPGR